MWEQVLTSLLCVRFWCLALSEALLKAFEQPGYSHVYGFSPVWDLRWVFRFSSLEYALTHPSNCNAKYVLLSISIHNYFVSNLINFNAWYSCKKSEEKWNIYSALVWFLSGVSSHVHDEHVLGFERFLSSRTPFPSAHKRFFVGVDVIVVNVLQGTQELGKHSKAPREILL